MTASAARAPTSKPTACALRPTKMPRDGARAARPPANPIASPAAQPRTALARAAFFKSAAYFDSALGSIHTASHFGTSMSRGRNTSCAHSHAIHETRPAVTPAVRAIAMIRCREHGRFPPETCGSIVAPSEVMAGWRGSPNSDDSIGCGRCTASPPCEPNADAGLDGASPRLVDVAAHTAGSIFQRRRNLNFHQSLCSRGIVFASPFWVSEGKANPESRTKL